MTSTSGMPEPDLAVAYEEARRIAVEIAFEVQIERLVDAILNEHAAGATRADLARVARRLLDETNGRLPHDVA